MFNTITKRNPSGNRIHTEKMQEIHYKLISVS